MIGWVLMWYCCSESARWQKAAVLLRTAFKLDLMMFSVNQIKCPCKNQCRISSHLYTPWSIALRPGKLYPLRGFSKAYCGGIRFQRWAAPCIDSCRMVVLLGGIYGCSLALTEMLSVGLWIRTCFIQCAHSSSLCNTCLRLPMNDVSVYVSKARQLYCSSKWLYDVHPSTYGSLLSEADLV